MNADLQDFKYKELTEKIIEIFYKVYNKRNRLVSLKLLLITEIKLLDYGD